MRLIATVLGDIQIVADETPVDVGGPRQRRLLAALLARRGSTVPTDRLVEIVFAGDPPDAALRTFRTYVSRLRRALDVSGIDRDSVILTLPSGYAAPSGLDLDAVRFEDLLRHARTLLDDGEPEAALSAVEEGLSWWSGPAFAEFADEDWARPEAMRLEELRTVAEELRAAAMVECGRHVEAIADLGVLVAAAPLREEPRRLSMLALYRAGRHAEALRAGREFRSLLGEQTGLEWSRSLADLEQRIIDRDPALDEERRERRLRGYVIGEKLVDHPDGATYRATQPSIGRDVAITVLDARTADHPDFVRRFETRARLIASIDHPNVVALHDYWREPGGAYLVASFPDGGSLAERLERADPLAPSDAARFVDEVGRGLCAASARDVHHGRLSSDWVWLDADGGVRIAGFSPCELDPATAGDVAGYARLVEQVWRRVATVAPGRDPADAVLAVAAAASDSPTSTTLERLVADVRAAADVAPSDTGDGDLDVRVRTRRRAVYRGLQPFDEPDADVFFGRRALVDALEADLGDRPFLALVGPSGSGKSSVVRAGLVPRLRASGAFVAAMVPGRYPIAQLEVALSRVSTVRVPDLACHLSRPDGLATALEEILPRPDAQLVLLIDQLEEAIITSDPEQSDLLLAGLVRTLDHDGSSLRVVATARADFLGRLLEHPTLGTLMRDHSRLITPLGAEELHEAIVGPASAGGVTVEPELVSALVADSVDAPGSLPLLQFALTELYDQRVDETMTLEAYHRLGGLGAPIAQRAEQVFLALGEDDRAAARRLFSRLVTPGDGAEATRRRVLDSELASVPRRVVDAFATARLVTFDRDPHTREPTVEIAHEALIRRWPRLQSWVDDDRAGMLLLRHLTDSAGTWADSGRDPGELYTGSRLEAAEEWVGSHGDDLTALERDFLEESVRARDRELERDRQRTRRLRRSTVGLALVTVVAVVSGVIAVGQRNRADEQRSNAETLALRAEEQRTIAEVNELEATRLAVQADVDRLTAEAVATLDVDSDLAILLALEAYEQSQRVEDEPPGAVVAALQQATQSSLVLERFEDAYSAAISPDGRHVVFADDDPRNPLRLVDLAGGEEIGRFGRYNAPGAVAFDPAGIAVAVVQQPWGQDTDRVQPGELVDTDTLEQVARLDAVCCVESLRFDPRGTLLAGGERVDGSQPAGSVTVWEVGDGSGRTVREHPRSQLVGWMPDGTTIALFDGRSVHFVDSATGAERLAAIDVGSVRSIDLDAAGERLLVVRETAEVWPVGGSEPSDVFALAKSDGPVQGRFSADGTHVLLFGGDEQIEVISTSSGERTVLRNGRDSVIDISESVDGTRLLVTSDRAVQLWDRSSTGPAELRNLPTGGVIEDIRFARDGSRVIVVEAGTGDDGVGDNRVGRRVREYDLESGTVLGSTTRYTSALIASDGGLVAVAPTGDRPGRIESSDPAAPTVELGPCDVPVAIDDADRWMLVSSGWDRSCGASGSRIVRPTTGEVLVELPDRRFVSAAVGPSGTIADGLVVAEAEIARDFPRWGDVFDAAARAIEVRRLSDGELIETWVEDDEAFRAPRFSSDGRHITIGSERTDGHAVDVERLLEGTSLRDAVVFVGPPLGRTTVTDAGGGWFVAGPSGSELRFYDLGTGEETMALSVEDGGAFEIAPDGRSLYYADGGTVRRFPFDPDELIALARSRVRRDFTVGECIRYSIADDCSPYSSSPAD